MDSKTGPAVQLQTIAFILLEQQAIRFEWSMTNSGRSWPDWLPLGFRKFYEISFPGQFH